MRLRGLVFALLVAGSMAMGSSPASAAPDWVPPAPVMPPSEALASVHRIGFDDQGRETVATVEVLGVTPFQTRVTIGTRLPGQPLQNEFTLDSSSGRLTTGIWLAVAPSGAAVACIEDLLGTNPATSPAGFRAMYRAAGSTTWTDPVVVADGAEKTAYTWDCETVVAANGIAAVIASQAIEEPPPSGEPRRSNVVVRVKPGVGGWTAPEVLSGADRATENPRAAIDGTGNVTVIWRERWAGNATEATADDRHTIKLRSRAASSGFFGLTQDLPGGEDNPSKQTYGGRIAVNDAGRAIVAWQEDSHSWATTRDDPSASFSAPQQAVTSGASSSPQAVGIAPDGTAYIGGWNQGISSSQSTAYIVRRQPGQAWSPTAKVGPLGVNYATSRMGFLGSDLYAVNESAVSSTSVLYAVRWRSGQPAPDAFRDLIPPGSDGTIVEQLLQDGQGGLAAVYDSTGTGSLIPTVVAYDASPPVNLALEVPGQVQPGKLASLSADFADRWSATGATTWDFGDGGTGSGDSVTHTWANPGNYTVTVTSADALGNERALTRQVSVVADKTRPRVTIGLPPCGKRKAKPCKAFRQKRAAWRTLRGTASDAGGAGLARVEVNVSRKTGRKFDVLTGKKIRKGRSAKRARNTWVRAKLKGGKWSLAIPKSWKPGSWTFRVRAVDRAGNVSKAVARKVKLR